MPDFPNSASSLKSALKIAAESNVQTYNELNLYLKTKNISINHLKSNSENRNSASEVLAQKLCTLLDFYGSDKGSYNQYHLVYGQILSKLNFEENVLIAEIGLGSNNTKIPSNMGRSGKPGASLRAWRDISENISVFGFDVDKQSLFEEARIKTFFLDQTDITSWKSLESILSEESVDVFIDDGLHTPSANLSFLNNAMKFVKTGGFLIIEDVPERALSIWQVIVNHNNSALKFQIFRARHNHIIVVQKLNKKDLSNLE